MVSKNRYRTFGVVAFSIGKQYEETCCNHVISLLLLLYVMSLIFIIIKRIIPCSLMYGITVVHRSQTTMHNLEENKRTRKNCV